MVHQRKRTDGHLFCSEAPCTKLQKQDDQNLHRQHDVDQIHNKGRRNCISTSSGYCDKNSGIMQQVRYRSILPACERNIEHRSGYLIEETGTGIREKPPQENSKGIETGMGSNTSGHICEQTQPTIPTVLQLETGPRRPGGGCLPVNLAEEDGLLSPSMETDTQGPSTHQSTAVRKGSPYQAELDNPVLVSNGNGDETPSTTKDLPLSISGVNRLALIRQAIQNQGLGEEEATYISESTRGSTSKIYDNGWKKWVEWCQTRGLNCQEYNINNVINFLVQKNQYSTTHLNTLRSSIASVFKYIHADKPALASNRKVLDFFATKRRKTIKIPKPHQLQTWNTDLLINYIRKHWLHNNTLQIETLQQKTIALLCLATMTRPRSDMGRLQHRDVGF